MGKNVRYENVACLIEGEIFAYTWSPSRVPLVYHTRELEYISICLVVGKERQLEATALVLPYSYMHFLTLGGAAQMGL